jgi:hypothetical protein
MPTFEFENGDVHISPQEFLDSCSPKEIKIIIKRIFGKYKMSAGEEMFEQHLTALHNNWNRLSNEEEKTIIEISKRFK